MFARLLNTIKPYFATRMRMGAPLCSTNIDCTRTGGACCCECASPTHPETPDPGQTGQTANANSIECHFRFLPNERRCAVQQLCGARMAAMCETLCVRQRPQQTNSNRVDINIHIAHHSDRADTRTGLHFTLRSVGRSDAIC